MEFWMNNITCGADVISINRIDSNHRIYTNSERTINNFIQMESKKYRHHGMR